MSPAKKSKKSRGLKASKKLDGVKPLKTAASASSGVAVGRRSYKPFSTN